MDPFVTDYDTSYCTMTILFFYEKEKVHMRSLLVAFQLLCEHVL